MWWVVAKMMGRGNTRWWFVVAIQRPPWWRRPLSGHWIGCRLLFFGPLRHKTGWISTWYIEERKLFDYVYYDKLCFWVTLIELCFFAANWFMVKYNTVDTVMLNTIQLTVTVAPSVSSLLAGEGEGRGLPFGAKREGSEVTWLAILLLCPSVAYF